MSTLQEARQSAPQAITDAGVDDLKALAAKLKKKHRSGAAAQQEQSNGGQGDAAAFLAGNGRAAVPNGNDEVADGEQPPKKRKKSKASQDGITLEKKGTRKIQDDDGLEAVPAVANGVGKKRKLKGGDSKAAAAQGAKPQHLDAGHEPVTADLQRTKKRQAKRTSVTDVN